MQGQRDKDRQTHAVKGREQLSQSEREQQVLAENVRLKRQLAEREEEVAILKKATAYFAKHHK